MLIVLFSLESASGVTAPGVAEKSNLRVSVDVAVCADEAGRLRGKEGCIFFVACPFLRNLLASSSYPIIINSYCLMSEAAWPSDQGVGLVILRSRVQVLHPAIR